MRPLEYVGVHNSGDEIDERERRVVSLLEHLDIVNYNGFVLWFR